MKTHGMLRRLLAFIMAAAVCFSVVPWTVFAAGETGTYTQVNAETEFTTGQYVLVTDTGYAPGVLDGSWITAAVPVIENGVVTDTAGAVWTLTVEGSSVKLTDSNGITVAPKGGNNGIQSGDYSWNWSFADGKFTFAGTGEDTVTLASNKSSESKFRAYKSATVSGNPNGYPSIFTLYKLAEQPGDTEPTETTVSAVATVDIATALAGEEGAEFTVKGVVTLLDGKNIFIQDATGGICLRVSDTPADLYLGATIIATGSKTVYSGLPQLGSGSYELSEGMVLAAKETTIGALTTADICTYVSIKGLEVTEVYDNNGSYSAPNITVTDGTNTIQLYKAVVGKTDGVWDVKVGDKLNIMAAVGIHNGITQLRNTMSSEIVITTVGETDPGAPEETVGITWTKVELADIQDTDTIAITMTKDGTTWVLPNVGEGSSGQPLATYRGTVDGSTLTTDTQLLYRWNIVAVGGGYHIVNVNGEYLYVTAANNGVRIGSTAAVWSVGERGYLQADASDATRYLGVYMDGPDWRCYKNTTGNTAGQTLGFWKLGDAESEDPEAPAWENEDKKFSIYEQVTELKDGDTVVIYNPGNGKALSSEDSSYYKAGVDAAVTGNYIASEADYIEWTVSVTDGVYTFTQGELALGIEQSGTYFNLKTNTGETGWTLQPTADGSSLYYMYSSTLEGSYGHVYLEWYASKSAFSAYCTGESRLTETDFGFDFYKLVREGAEEEEPAAPVIADGDYVLWVGGEYNMALSTVYDGFYNTGVAVTYDETTGKLSGCTEAEVWTVTNNDDGTVSIFTASGDKLAMGASFSSMPLNDVNDTWTVTAADESSYYVQNVGRGQCIQWYASKEYWSGYYLTEGSAVFMIHFTSVADVDFGTEEEPENSTGIADGDYVIWAPAYNMALSSNYSGYYNAGVELTVDGDRISGYGNTEIWSITNNADGTITISCDGGKLAMDTGFSSMPLNAVNDTWTIEDAGNGLWYVKNVGRQCYIEWYEASKYWSGYYNISTDSEGMFALKFTPAERGFNTDAAVVENIAQWGGMPKPENTTSVNGDKYVSGDEMDTEDVYTAVVSGAPVIPYTVGGNNDAPLYYMGGTGLGSGTNDYLQFAMNAAGWGDMELSFRLRSSNSGPGTFQLCYSTDNGESWQNFTTGSYAYAYTAWNSEGSYPVTGEGNITDGIAKPSLAAANYVSFVFDVPAGADNCGDLLIRLVPGSDRANGSSGTISTGGTVRIDTVIISGSPIVDDSVTGYVTVTPNGEEGQAVGTELTMTSATEGAAIYYRVDGGEWVAYDPENKPALTSLPCNMEVYASSEGKADSVVLLYTYAAGSVETVKFSPNGGGLYIEGESTEVSLSTATEGATIYYATSPDGVTFTEYAEYTAPIVVTKGFGKLVVKAHAVKDGFSSSPEVTRTFTERASFEYSIYFGQLHSHTNISDGSGSVEEAFEHASNVEGLDFLAVTDHSNSFDNEGSGILGEDGFSISDEWAQGHAAAEAVTDEDFVGLYGFEMTWSNGLGHINTFNTPGWQSRTQAEFKTQSTALQNYYATLATVPESISQFNHPGTTFGDFSDFAHYSESTDALITLIEVGNGEGAIGSSGYFPSYEYYTRALDKGWHVAPTNNQDNHKGLWGDANTGRSVILADSLTEEGIYDALRNYRVYATEDNDLEIYYTLNGFIMGSILDISDVEEAVSLSVRLSDSTDSSIGKVEVIVNGGLSIAEQTVAGSSQTVSFTVSSDYNYYYIKITQPDGDIAVTAPVWVGKVEAVGVSSLEAGSALTIAGEEQTISAELFNNERRDLIVDSVVFTNKQSGEVIYTDTTITSVPKESTASCSFAYTFPKDGIYTITVTVKGTLDGVEKTYTKDLEITVMPKNVTSLVIVDGTHYNDYVTGYYGGNTANMTAIAAEQGIKVHVETEKITAQMLESCELLIISAPAKKSGTANAGTYEAMQFSDEFIAMVTDYVKAGGNVILCGLADYQDKGATFGVEGHTAAQINKLLCAIGSTMSVNDDETYDEVNNGGQAYRLYPESFNTESKWTAGIAAGQVYSQYSGCTVNVGQGTWLVKGFDTTYSIDSDTDGIGGVNKGEAVFLAVEETAYGGNIFVAGGVFISDFEVKAELDNIWDLPYANRTIYENILGITRTQPEITPIAQVRESAQAALGSIFVIEGYVTAGTANENTKFFDAIYLQDETGGITVFPYSELGLALGTKVRITGYTDAYQGDIEIQIMSYEILDEPKNIIAPEKMNNRDAMNYDENGGELLQVEGEVVEVLLTSDGRGVAQFVVKDANGDTAKVFIDGYILSGTKGINDLASIVKVGNTVSAVGLLYMHPEGDSIEPVVVLRVRDCDEVVLVKAKAEDKTPEETTKPIESEETTQPTGATEPSETTKPTEITRPGTGNNAQTGDESPIVACMGVMMVSMIGLALLLLSRKKYIV